MTNLPMSMLTENIETSANLTDVDYVLIVIIKVKVGRRQQMTFFIYLPIKKVKIKSAPCDFVGLLRCTLK